jgi:hypothetical protein
MTSLLNFSDSLAILLSILTFILVIIRAIWREIKTEHHTYFVRVYYKTFFTGSGYASQLRYAKLFASKSEASVGQREKEKIIPVIMEITC